MNVISTSDESLPSALEDMAEKALERFVDALCHFAGEAPALHELERSLGEDAVVVEVGASDCDRTEWLGRLAERALARRDEGLGHFVVIHSLEVIAIGDRLAFAVLGVTVRDTKRSAVARAGTARIEVVARRVGQRLSITRLMVGPADAAV